MIVKVTSWVKPGKTAKLKAKGTVRYLAHRPDRKGEAQTRPLFSADGPLTRYQAYALIDSARRGSVFLRLTISPSPNSEDIKRDLDLWALTQYTLRELKGKLHKDIEYVGAVHADHSSVRHVNLLLLIPGRIPRQEFFALPKFLREKAKIEAQKQRELLDPMPKMEGAHTVLRQDPRVNPRSQAFEPRNFRSSHYLALTCPDCGTNQRLWKTSFSEYFCSNCHSRFAPSVFGGLTRREELSL